ncbi:MAG: cytochrome c biogenesis protein ResB [Chitinispirillaceae bacterium]|nr:cytochrome c biogenesis protein ResB [Chitinispirillaceae bacterium]
MRFIQNCIRLSGSIKLTIICLIITFILVAGGTVYQIDNGLLAAQDRFFSSWGLFLFGFILFPGMKTIAIILSLNLILNGLKSFSLSFKKSGVLLMHIGIIVLFAGTALASIYIKESVLTIYERQKTTFSRDFSLWELIVLKKQHNSANHGYFVSDTVHFNKLKNDTKITFPNTSISLAFKKLYQNCTAPSIDSLQPQKISADQAGNFPGIEAVVISKNNIENSENRLLLYGGKIDPVLFTMADDTLYFMLKPHEIRLPFEISLNRFVNINHPGTTDAKSYESHLTVRGDGINRDVVITMNRPFRYKSLTFYQNGFMTQNSFNATTLFVVDNPFRFVPYISGLIIIVGLFITFTGKFAGSVIRLKNNNSDKK